jgi:hypothetical protein
MKMKTKFRTKGLVISLLWLALFAGCATPESSSLDPTAMAEPPDKILIIGNSLIATYEDMGRQGLDYHLEQLAGSATPPLDLQADALYRDGTTLQGFWSETNAREMIREGGYDIVVLQEDLPMTDVDTFKAVMRKFDEEIKGSGAKTLIYMCWAYNRLGRISMNEIEQAHRDIAEELGIDVAPVGLAFPGALKERPDLYMFYDEGEHPHLIGSYLAANVVYATIFRESPIGLTYLPDMEGGVTVSEEEAAFLQRVAWETVEDYQAQE